jgi:hypothetical protein
MSHETSRSEARFSFRILLQDCLKTGVWLDGGYFLVTRQTGSDQADFTLRMKKPVLMVNGRYDYGRGSGVSRISGSAKTPCAVAPVLLNWKKQFDTVMICDIPDTCTSVALDPLVVLLPQRRASFLVDVANGIRFYPIAIHIEL